MKRVVEEQQLGFVATVCSPGAIANLRANPAIEINVVDPLVRKGYRFKGVAQVLSEGPDYEAGLEFYRRRGSASAKPHIVLVKVGRAAELVSPPYGSGQSEAAVISKWRAYWEGLWSRKT